MAFNTPTKITKEKVNYNNDIQTLLVTMMISDPSLFVRCQTILKPSYFDRSLAPTVKYILDYSEKYKGLPSVEMIKAETKLELAHIDINSSHSEYFLETIEKFSRHKAIEAAILQSADLIENAFYDDVEAIIKEAVLVSLKRDLGLNYYENPRERLERMLKQNGTIKTGWKDFDDIIYNISRGELIIFTAISGGGKSVALQNLAVNWSKQNHNVVYFSFELNQDLVAKRMDALLTGISNISIFRQIDKVEYLVKQGEKHNGKIQIVYLPSGTCTNDLRAWLKEYQIQYGVTPDMIMVDYLGLMRPNSKRIDPSNLYIKDKFVSEELRALAAELQCVCATAAQTNRCLEINSIVIDRVKGNTCINTLSVGDEILSKNGKFNKVRIVYPKEKQKVYKITTKSGKIIECSDLHLFPTENGFKNIQEGLICGDKLLVKKENI